MSDLSKADLRAQYRKLRADHVDALSAGERSLAFSKAPGPLRQMFQPGATVAGYLPLGSEADPQALMQEAMEAGCKLALPHVSGLAAPMRFLEWTPGDPLDDGPLGLRQPKPDASPCRPDLVLVPLVAFDARLMRLGQGAGHYDRALSLLPDSPAIGIAWSVQQAPALPSDPWDVPMDAILTEKAWIAP